MVSESAGVTIQVTGVASPDCSVSGLLAVAHPAPHQPQSQETKPAGQEEEAGAGAGPRPGAGGQESAAWGTGQGEWPAVICG